MKKMVLLGLFFFTPIYSETITLNNGYQTTKSKRSNILFSNKKNTVPMTQLEPAPAKKPVNADDQAMQELNDLNALLDDLGTLK